MYAVGVLKRYSVLRPWYLTHITALTSHGIEDAISLMASLLH